MRHLATRLAIAAAALATLLVGVAASQTGKSDPRAHKPPEAEFHFARMMYATYGGGGSHGYFQPWWAIDYPLAEAHFLPALRRMSNMDVAEDSRHIDIIDERVFQYPFLFMQQP